MFALKRSLKHDAHLRWRGIGTNEGGTMHRKIGMLTVKVDTILEGVRRLEEKSDVSRASMHWRVDEIVNRVSKVDLTTSAVRGDGTEMKTIGEETARDRRPRSLIPALMGHPVFRIKGCALGQVLMGAPLLSWAISR
ncbi:MULTISPECIES: DUF1515 family protein [Rhizobium]|uniref:DUF1515 family protein n=1 Tax=Rhizobium TaxID=379 RepID=UPI001FD0A765|nr:MULTISPECIES: DUF1515 family protein [Rhizobium]